MINLNVVNQMPQSVKLYYLVRILLLLLLPTLFLILIPSARNYWLSIFFTLIMIIGLPVYIVLLIDYVFFKFIIEENKMTVNSGLLIKHSKSIPFDRIQNIESIRGVLSQLFGLSTVKIWTASASQINIAKGSTENKPESSFILKTEDAEWLKNFIFDKRQKV